MGLLSWVATRWNSKLDSMRRVLELHDAINYVISQKGAQTQSYRLRDDEVACLPGVFQVMKIVIFNKFFEDCEHTVFRTCCPFP